MAASFSQIASLCVAELNANSTYTTATNDPRFYTNQIRDAIANADAAVCLLILGDPDNPYRGEFSSTSSSVAHGGVIPSHISPVISVVISSKGAQLWPKSEIEFERDNSLALTTIKPHYFIDEDKVLFHNGVSNATVHYYTFTQSVTDPPVLQCPDGLADAVACRALAFLFSVEGENTQVAEHYEAMWKDFVAAILGRAKLPHLTSP